MFSGLALFSWQARALLFIITTSVLLFVGCIIYGTLFVVHNAPPPISLVAMMVGVDLCFSCLFVRAGFALLDWLLSDDRFDEEADISR